MDITIGLISLGCPKNLVDSENMLGILEKDGFIITSQPEDADVIIVNTCGFIETAKEEAISEILQMAEYKKTGKCSKLIMSGCLAERYSEELFAEMPEVDVITGAHAWGEINKVVKKALKGERFIFKPEHPKKFKKIPRKLTSNSCTAYLKIAEGCSNVCSYCVIPHIRGPYVSREMPAIIAEAKQLAKQGIKELILVAQDVTRYGDDLYGDLLLPELLKELVKIKDIKWIRLLYAYPGYITQDLLEVMATEDKICKYIDIPLQHASDTVLSRMNRKDTKFEIMRLLDIMREQVPGIAIRTTFIVGFPGETQEEYEELKAFMLREKFDRAGIFIYSQEEGTVAADMPQVDDAIKEERYHELMALQAQISEEINQSLEGRQMEILVEGVQKDGKDIVVFGRSYREAPDIDGVVYLENAANAKVNTFVKAEIVQGFTYDVLAEMTK